MCEKSDLWVQELGVSIPLDVRLISDSGHGSPKGGQTVLPVAWELPWLNSGHVPFCHGHTLPTGLLLVSKYPKLHFLFSEKPRKTHPDTAALSKHTSAQWLGFLISKSYGTAVFTGLRIQMRPTSQPPPSICLHSGLKGATHVSM